MRENCRNCIGRREKGSTGEEDSKTGGVEREGIGRLEQEKQEWEESGGKLNETGRGMGRNSGTRVDHKPTYKIFPVYQQFRRKFG